MYLQEIEEYLPELESKIKKAQDKWYSDNLESSYWDYYLLNVAYNNYCFVLGYEGYTKHSL